MNQGLPARIQVHALAVSGPRVFAGLYSKGIYVSSDGGANWKRAGEVHPYSLAVGGGAVYAGHVPGGVFVTSDQGESWREATTGLPEQCVVYALLCVGRSVFAGTLGEAGIYRSTDGGRSWKPARRGLPSDASVISLAACGRLLVAAIEATRRHGAGRPARDAS